MNQDIDEEAQTVATDIPHLRLNIKESAGDFITKEIEVESKGYSIVECERGIRFLLEQSKEVRG